MRSTPAPASLVVAGFVGSPAMNLLDARLEPGGPTLSLGHQRLALPTPPAADPGQLVLGIRPEHVLVGPGPPIGRRQPRPSANRRVRTRSPGSTSTASVSPPAWKPARRRALDTHVGLTLDLAHASFFSAASGRRL